ncbi:MAG: glycosyltransferase [Candidatus Nanopelagicaceae bacterium]|nr:glycosyltransferase [Candidatus Nanopelagicaceae bacterium]
MEFENPHGYGVSLTKPDGKQLSVSKKGRIVLDEWFQRYCPKYLRIIRIIDQPQPASIPVGEVKKKPVVPVLLSMSPRRRPVVIGTVDHRAYSVIQNNLPVPPRKFVGRTTKHSAEATQHCESTFKTLDRLKPSFSNNIGVGILSYNRLESLQRLITSIRRLTDMSHTLVFVSDDASSADVRLWLQQQPDIIAVCNEQNLGVAGNTNRLLRCLDRFRYKIILNDDVEVLVPGWDRFYVDVMIRTGYHHFCYRQPGLYGAAESEGIKTPRGDVTVLTVKEKPHGAVLAFDDVAFNAVGYFDEQFGKYGMEHVDWSHRIGLSGIQPPGYHDANGSSKYFKIHKNRSATEGRNHSLAEAKNAFERLAGDRSRIFVKASDKTVVPKMSFVVPFRGGDRISAVSAVVSSVRAQLYPQVEIVVVEEDATAHLQKEDLSPCQLLFCESPRGVHFSKARAFNMGVMRASSDFIILHDADMLTQMNYAQLADEQFKKFEAFHMGKEVVYFSQDATNRICRSQKFDGVTCDSTVGYYEGGSLGCYKKKYEEVGGFYEAFVGFGVEDCEFFRRLKRLSKFNDERTIVLFHLWHGRTDGWTQRHKINKQIGADFESLPMETRLKRLREGLAKWQPQAGS